MRSPAAPAAAARIALRGAGLLAVLVVATGCGQSAAAAGPPPAAYPGAAGPFRAGPDEVTVLPRGLTAFPAIRRLIRGAVRTVDVEMYELQRRDLVGELAAARGRGVRVTVITDPSVDASLVSAAGLRAAGVDVLLYPVRAMNIDHVKLVVVDGSAAVVGGINWGAASLRHHDVDLLLRGPAAANLDRVFRRDLVTCGRAVTVPDEVPDPAITVAATLPAIEIRPMLVDAIDGASRHLDLELYVLTDSGIVHAIERAGARGVAVRVLLDPDQRPSDASAAELRAAGIAVRLYRGRGEKLHAKTAVVDEGTVIVGSANWSAGGFRRNHELDVEVHDAPGVARVLESAMDADWSASG